MLPNIKELLHNHLQVMTSQPVTLLPLILFLIFLYKWVQGKSVSKTKLPPSPPKLPVFGNLHQLGTLPHRSLRSLSEKYGELMLIHVGSAPALVVSSASAAQEILITHDVTFSNRPISKKGRKLLYNCKDVAAAPYGEYWRQMRSLCVLHLLSNSMVRSFHRVREEEITLLIENIKCSASSPLNLTKMFTDFINDIVCRVAFGRKYREKEHGVNFSELVKDYMKLLGEFNVGDFVPWLAWIDKFNGLDAKVDKLATDFDHFLEKIVQEHQDSQERRKSTNAENEEKDFVDVLLDVQNDSTARFPLDIYSIKALILDMFTGGTDTTSTLLEWTMSELLRHPQVMQELQRELRGFTREKSYINEDDLEQMKYLKAVIKETLRLHPPAPLLASRLSSADTKIHGYDVPVGTAVITNAWAIHRDPSYWNEPEKFKPDRFLNSTMDFRGQDSHFIPFGAGRRICPGIIFSMANTELLLAKLIQRFDWTLPSAAEGDTLDISECFGMTMHRKTPLLAIALDHNCK